MGIGRLLFRVSLGFISCFSSLSCSGTSASSSSSSNVHFPSFNDITAAPAAIQTAAKAVVRVETAWTSASGSFISATGLLLTNNHVLGDAVCPLEGCYIEVTFMHQRGAARQQPYIVFAVPFAVDVGMDMAVVQLYDQPSGPMLSSPAYLTVNAQDPSSLIGRHVTIVGHPEGALKKWTDGVVVDASGKWITSTAYTLPGDSGSPMLDDNGEIVGLLHRGPGSEDLFAADQVNVYSIGTASAPIATALAAPTLPSTVISIDATTTAADFVANDFVYLNAHTSSVNVSGLATNALTLLGQACDAALARNDFQSPDDLDAALTPCYHAEAWIDCRSDATPVSYGVVCPSGVNNQNWANRWQAANQLSVAMNGQVDYYAVSFPIARLQSTSVAGIAAGATSLQQALAGPAPSLDFELANYLAAFNISSYTGKNIENYVVNYKSVLHYELEARYAAYASGWLYYFGLLSKSDLVTLLTQLYDDSNTDVGTKLYVEDFEYNLGAL